jgi:hypothetical protein
MPATARHHTGAGYLPHATTPYPVGTHGERHREREVAWWRRPPPAAVGDDRPGESAGGGGPSCHYWIPRRHHRRISRPCHGRIYICGRRRVGAPASKAADPAREEGSELKEGR